MGKPSETGQLMLWAVDEPESSPATPRPPARRRSALLAAPEHVRAAVAREVRGYPSFSHLRLGVELYPYSDVKITARVEDGALRMRLSDAFQAAEEETIRAAARIMLRRLRGRRTLAADHAVFNRFSETPAARAYLVPARPTTVRRYQHKGRVHDLSALFDALNRRYFSGLLAHSKLGWSPSFKNRWGSYYPDNDLILLNGKLDEPGVPRLAVEFVLYHEMLHKRHGYRLVGGRRQYHTAEFRADERKFAGYAEAQRWCERATWKRRRTKA